MVWGSKEAATAIAEAVNIAPIIRIAISFFQKISSTFSELGQAGCYRLPAVAKSAGRRLKYGYLTSSVSTAGGRLAANRPQPPMITNLLPRLAAVCCVAFRS